MSAEDATIIGEITATAGRIGDWIIDSGSNALRDDNSEIVLEPNIPEIQMYSGSSKKVVISPLGELSSISNTTTNVKVAPIASSGGNWSSLTSAGTSANPLYGLVGAASSSVTGPDASSGTTTFTAPSPGDYSIQMSVPGFTVKNPGAAATGTVSAPTYNASYSGQQHGFVNPRKSFARADLYLCAFDNSNNEDDVIFDKAIIDRASLNIIDGSIIDFKVEMIGESFVINNPKASSSCGCGLSFSV